VYARKARLDALRSAASTFEQEEHFDALNLFKKHVMLVTRFACLRKPMHKRREKLQQVQRVQQFYRELEDEKPWIRE